MQPCFLCVVFGINIDIMKRFCAFVILLAVALPVLAQQIEEREPGSFSGVRVSEGIDVYLQQGERERVRVEVEGTDPSNILTEISGSYLKIHRKGNVFGNNIEAKVDVTYVNIDKPYASSAGSTYSEDPSQSHHMEV